MLRRPLMLALLSILLCGGLLIGEWYLAPIDWPGSGLRPVWLVVGMRFIVAMATIILHAMAAGLVNIAVPAVATMVARPTFISTRALIPPPGSLEWPVRAAVYALYFASAVWLISSYRRSPWKPGSAAHPLGGRLNITSRLRARIPDGIQPQ